MKRYYNILHSPMYPTVPTLPLTDCPSGMCTARPKSEMRICPDYGKPDVQVLIQHCVIAKNKYTQSLKMFFQHMVLMYMYIREMAYPRRPTECYQASYPCTKDIMAVIMWLQPYTIVSELCTHRHVATTISCVHIDHVHALHMLHTHTRTWLWNASENAGHLHTNTCLDIPVRYSCCM